MNDLAIWLLGLLKPTLKVSGMITADKYIFLLVKGWL